MLFCAHCGGATTEDARSCPRCGTLQSLSESPGSAVSCDACAAPVATSWRYCTTCGAAIDQSHRHGLVRTSIEAEAGSFHPSPDAGDQPRAAADSAPGIDLWPTDLHP